MAAEMTVRGAATGPGEGADRMWGVWRNDLAVNLRIERQRPGPVDEAWKGRQTAEERPGKE